MGSVGMVIVGLLLVGGAGAGLAADQGSKPKQAMFKTKAEAEAADEAAEGAGGTASSSRQRLRRGTAHSPL